MPSAVRVGKAVKQVRVLVAVQPASLFDVMKHLLAETPEVQVVSSPDDQDSLSDQARRLQPDLVVTNTYKLGPQASALLKDTRRVSPRSKILVTDFDIRFAG